MANVDKMGSCRAGMVGIPAGNARGERSRGNGRVESFCLDRFDPWDKPEPSVVERFLRKINIVTIPDASPVVPISTKPLPSVEANLEGYHTARNMCKQEGKHLPTPLEWDRAHHVSLVLRRFSITEPITGRTIVGFRFPPISLRIGWGALEILDFNDMWVLDGRYPWELTYDPQTDHYFIGSRGALGISEFLPIEYNDYPKIDRVVVRCASDPQ